MAKKKDKLVVKQDGVVANGKGGYFSKGDQLPEVPQCVEKALIGRGYVG